MGRKTFTGPIGGTQSINQLFVITSASSALMVRWIRQELDKRSVVCADMSGWKTMLV